MTKYFSLVVLCCSALFVQAKTIEQKIYINSGAFTTVDNKSFPMWCFNSSPQFSARNTALTLAPKDTLILTVVNNDARPHGFLLKGYSTTSKTIAPNTSIKDTMVFSNEGIFLFYDPLNSPANRYMGLAGMICVTGARNAKLYYWNLKEHQMLYSQNISADKSVDWKKYYPDYFTINGLSHPDLQNDNTARIIGKIGDTIRIFVANTGQSKHSLHFHGFHSKVISSTHKILSVNSSKDTFPMLSMEAAILELIPDKEGDYSVHDHNLVAISGGGMHPNGMFLIMKIEK